MCLWGERMEKKAVVMSGTDSRRAVVSGQRAQLVSDLNPKPKKK